VKSKLSTNVDLHIFTSPSQSLRRLRDAISVLGIADWSDVIGIFQYQWCSAQSTNNTQKLFHLPRHIYAS